MTEGGVDSTIIYARLAKLERQNGRLRAGLILIVVGMVVLLSTGAILRPPIARTVSAHKFALVDSAGKPRATLDFYKAGKRPTLDFYTDTLRIPGSPEFKLLDETGKTRAELTLGGGEGGVLAFYPSATAPDPRPDMFISNRYMTFFGSHFPAINIGVDTFGVSSLWITSSKGDGNTSLTLGESNYDQTGESNYDQTHEQKQKPYFGLRVQSEPGFAQLGAYRQKAVAFEMQDDKTENSILANASSITFSREPGAPLNSALTIEHFGGYDIRQWP